MAYDLGDPIPLSVTVRNAAGAAENATSMVLTVTAPDGTAATPAVTGTTGVYTLGAPYLATQSGRYTTRWVATGTNACTMSDTFSVLASDPGFIISLTEARAGLGVAVANTAKDEDLRTFMAAATPIIEDIVGAVLNTPRVETHDGGSPQIVLLWGPVISVTSIIESYGSTFQRTLTAQDVFTPGSGDAFGYTIDQLLGTVTRRATGIAAPFAAGRRNIQVTYVSGRNPIPPNILLATRRLVRHLWSQEQQSFRPNVLSVAEPMTVTPSGFAVPAAVVELCAPHARPPGLA